MSTAYQTLTFTGNSDWRQVGSSGLDADDWDFDTLTRVYEGRKDKLAAFLRTIPKNLQDREFPWLFKLSHSISDVSGAWLTCNVEFKGTLDRQPKLKRSVSQRLQPLELRGSGSSTQAQYYGPVWTFRYIATSFPDTAIYRAEVEKLAAVDDYEIVNQRGEGRVGIAVGSAPAGTAGPVSTVKFPLAPRVVRSRFDRDEVGMCWQCIEEYEGRLESSELSGGLIRR